MLPVLYMFTVKDLLFWENVLLMILDVVLCSSYAGASVIKSLEHYLEHL